MRGIRSTALGKSIIDESLGGERTSLLNSVENFLFSSSCLFVFLKRFESLGVEGDSCLATFGDTPEHRWHHVLTPSRGESFDARQVRGHVHRAAVKVVHRQPM